MSDETKNVTLKSTSGAKVYPTAILDQLIADKDNSSSYVTRGGVIKREYLPREITVLIGCFDSAPDLDEVQNNDRYYNTTTKKVAVCWTNSSGEKEWSEGVPEQDRMFLDLSTACLMFFHDNDMYMCNSENASSLTSGVVVDSATNATSAKTAKAVDAAVSSAIVSAAVESAGAVTGIASVVSGGTATITATGSTTSVDIVGTGGVDVRGNTTTGAVELDAKDLSDGTQSVSKELENARWVTTHIDTQTRAPQYALTLVHVSDVHGDSAALNRIVSDARGKGGVIGYICTGDMVEQYNGQIASWWNPSVMTCIGNHDCADESNQDWTYLTMAQRAQYYIEPFESGWGITHTAGTSYYYKDYSVQKVRLIVMDAMLYYGPTTSEAEEQTTWLTGLLDSAISSNLHVVVACHAPIGGSVLTQCSFSQLGYLSNPPTDTVGVYLPVSIAELIRTKQNSGLKFVGYLCGHFHRDLVWDVFGDGTQYMYGIVCSLTNNVARWYKEDLMRDSTLDAYNLVTIDTYNNRVTIVRGGGANVDYLGRERKMITVNYVTGEVIDREIPRLRGEGRVQVDGIEIRERRYIDTETITGSTVTLQAGHAYNASVTGTLTLNVETPPSSASYGLDGLIDVDVTGGTILAGENVYLAESITDGARNICSVRFVDGIAIVNPILVIAPPFEGYVVSITSGTSDGTLYYGLASSTDTDIGFSASVDFQTIDLGNAVTNGEKNLIGNGFAKTVISGGVSCTSSTTIKNASLSDVTILGGTMTIFNGNIPADKSVSVVGFAELIDVSGSGTIDMSNHADSASPACYTSGGTATITGVTFSGASVCRAYYADNADITLSECVVTNNTGNISDEGLAQGGGSSYITGCTFSHNSAAPSQSGFAGAGIHLFGGGIAHVESSVFEYNNAGTGKGGGFAANISGTTQTVINGCTFASNTVVGANATGGGGGVTVYNSGTALVSNCVFSNNIVSSGYGGAIFTAVNATVIVSSCDIDKCSCSYRGGAIGCSNGFASAISCNITSCYSPTGGAVMVAGGRATITACTINKCSARDGVVNVSNKGSASIVSCTFSGCSATNTLMYGYGQAGRLTVSGCSFLDCNCTRLQTLETEANPTSATNAYYTSCTVSGGTMTNGVFWTTTSVGKLYLSGTTVTNVSGGTGYLDVCAQRNASAYLLGGNNVGLVRANSDGAVVFAGENTISALDTITGGYVTISSGASINLADSMNAGEGRITVLTGGCVVNGATIAAGTYTQIVSSGGSAVAS